MASLAEMDKDLEYAQRKILDVCVDCGHKVPVGSRKPLVGYNIPQPKEIVCSNCSIGRFIELFNKRECQFESLEIKDE